MLLYSNTGVWTMKKHRPLKIGDDVSAARFLYLTNGLSAYQELIFRLDLVMIDEIDACLF